MKTRADRRYETLISNESLFCSCCSDPPDPPDMSATAAASEEVARIAQETAREQLEWSKDVWQDQQALMQDVLDVQLPMMRERYAQSAADRARYEELYQPIEDALIQEFETYATPERAAAESARRQADVAAAHEAQRQQALQRLESYGVDPSQTRNQALDIGMRTEQAAQMAAAGAQGRQQVEDIGRALRAEAINIGRGYPSQVAQSYGQTLESGRTAAGIQNQALATQGQLRNVSPYYGAATQALGTAGNIMNQQYGNQLAAYQAGGQGWAGLGQLAGTLGGAYMGGLGRSGANPFGWAEGGEVTGPGGPKDDAIPAQLSDGEYVIPAEVVRRKGTEFLDKMVAKSREELAAKAIPNGEPTPESPINTAALPAPMRY